MMAASVLGTDRGVKLEPTRHTADTHKKAKHMVRGSVRPFEVFSRWPKMDDPACRIPSNVTPCFHGSSTAATPKLKQKGTGPFQWPCESHSI